jgi:hypothetical protein
VFFSILLGASALAEQDHAKFLALQSEAIDPRRCNKAASVQDNVMFGRIACGVVDATAAVARAVAREALAGCARMSRGTAKQARGGRK